MSRQLHAAIPWMLCVCITAMLNAHWLHRHGVGDLPLMGDEARWHQEAQSFHTLLKSEGVGAFLWAGHTHERHPPLLAMSAAVVTLCLGRSVDAPALWVTMLCWTALWFWCAARILRLWLSERDTRAALAVCVCMPPLLSEGRHFSPALAASALTLAALDQLLRSQRFRATWRALAAGTWTGFAALVSNSGAVCMVGALIWANVRALSDGSEKILRARMRNLFYVVNMGLLVVAPWYLAHHEEAWSSMDSALGADAPHAASSALFSVQRMLWLPAELLRTLGVLTVLWIAAGAWRVLRRGTSVAAVDGSLETAERAPAREIVIVTALCAALLLTLLRPGAGLTDLLALLPFGALLCVRACGTRRWLLLLLCVPLLIAALRPPADDRAWPDCDGIGVVPAVDPRHGARLQRLGVIDGSSAQWPLRASVAAALALSPDAQPTLCVLHADARGTPGLETANFERLAEESGQSVRVRPIAPDSTAAELHAMLADCTIVLADDSAHAAERLISAARGEGAALTRLGGFPLSESRSFTLYEFSRRGARPRHLRRAAFDALGCAPSATPLCDGWVFLGHEHCPDGGCTVFLEGGGTEPLQGVLLCAEPQGPARVQRRGFQRRWDGDAARTVIALRFAADPAPEQSFLLAPPAAPVRLLRQTETGRVPLRAP